MHKAGAVGRGDQAAHPDICDVHVDIDIIDIILLAVYLSAAHEVFLKRHGGGIEAVWYRAAEQLPVLGIEGSVHTAAVRVNVVPLEAPVVKFEPVGVFHHDLDEPACRIVRNSVCIYDEHEYQHHSRQQQHHERDPQRHSELDGHMLNPPSAPSRCPRRSG